MPNPRYLSGRRLEYRVKKALEASGWWCIRAASSKGRADLVAVLRGRRGIDGPRVVLVQCKRGRSSRTEETALDALAVNLSIESYLVTTEKGKLMARPPLSETWEPLENCL